MSALHLNLPWWRGVVLLGLALLIACGGPTSREEGRRVPATEARGEVQEIEGVALTRVRHLGSTYRVVTVDLRSVDLDLYGLTPGEGDIHTVSALRGWLRGRGRRLLMATNSGIFGRARLPMGLHVERGRQLHALNVDSGFGNFFLKPNAVFYVRGLGDEGSAHVVRSELFSERLGNLRLATQSGPALLLDGELHPGFTPDSSSLKLRSGVGASATESHIVRFAISEGRVRFHDFATLFRDALGSSDALYLDGSISVLCAPDCGDEERADNAFGALLAVTVLATT